MKKLILRLTFALLPMLLMASPALAEEPFACEYVYTVQAGDWLSKIAEKYLGDPLAYPELVEAANSSSDDMYTDIANADLIEPGWVICIPPVDDTASSAPEATDSALIGVIWEWQNFKDQAGANDITVPDPYNYRLQLRPDGTYGFKADCNSGSGSYTLEGSNLTFSTLFATTMAECGPTSLYNQYLGFLGQVATYVQPNADSLVLDLIADAGNMNFSKLNAVTGRITTSGEATLPQGAIAEVKVLDATNTQMGGESQDVTGFPINFEATYNTAAVDPNSLYHLEVTVSDSQGNVLFANIQTYNVLTQGNPTYDVEVVVEPASSQSATGGSILDIVWQWTELTGTAVNPPQTIPNPENYTIVFRADGTYNGKADCNRISGTTPQKTAG